MKKACIKRIATIMVFLAGSLFILPGGQSNVVAEKDLGVDPAAKKQPIKMPPDLSPEQWIEIFYGLSFEQQLEELGISMEPSKEKVPSRYDPTPIPVNISKDQFNTALQTVKNNIFFLGFHFRDAVMIEFDSFLIPNGMFAEVRPEWVSVVNADGVNILREPTAEEKEGPAARIWQPGKDRLFLSDRETRPIYAEGKMQITVPIRFAHTAFDAGDVGKTRQSTPLTATLLRLENDLVSLKIKGVPEKLRPVVVLRDDTGGRLKVCSSVSKRCLVGDGIRSMYRAYGRIAKVEVFLPIEFSSSTLTVRATSAPRTFGDDAWQVKAPRYMPDPGEPNFVEMDLATLKAETRVVARRSYALIGFNTPGIRVYLPRMDNSAFAHVKFGEPKLSNAGGDSIDYSLVRGVYTHETFSDEIRFTVEDEEKPIEFARAVGTVNIRYPARLKVTTLTTEQMKSGGLEVQFHGPKVMIRGMGNLPFRPFLPYSLTSVRAYDDTNRRLKRLSCGSRVKNNIKWKLAGFWGEPRELRIVTIEEWIEMELPFDLPPAPKFPESQRGTRPAEYE